MEIDTELLEDFAEEMSEIKGKLSLITDELSKNISQPPLFGQFSQLCDGIYGTALSLGLNNIANYAGTLREICKKTSESEIPRIMPSVLKMMKRFNENLGLLQDSIKDPQVLETIQQEMAKDAKIAKKMDQDVFAYFKKS